MKKTLYFAFTILCLCLFAGCSDDDDNGTTPDYARIAGEWHLSVWSGEAPGFDAYVAFAADRSFVIYQKIEKSTWESYSGSYQLDGETLSGIYSSGKPWGSSYKAVFDEKNKTLTLTSLNEIPEVSVYVSEAIPASVKNAAKPVRSSQSSGFLLF